MTWLHALKGATFKRLALGSVWNVAGAVINRGAMLGLSMILSTLLPLDDMGIFGIVQLTVSTSITVVLFGLGISVTRFVAEFNGTDASKAWCVFCAGNRVVNWVAAVVSVFIALTSPIISRQVLGSESYYWVFLFVAGIVFLSASESIRNSALQGFGDFRASAGINIAKALVVVLLAVLLAKLFGLIGVLIAIASGALIGVVLARRFIVRHMSIRDVVHADFCKGRFSLAELYSFGLPAAFSGVIVVGVNWLVPVLLAQGGAGVGAAGVFFLVTQWYLLIAFLPSVVSQVLLPVAIGFKSNSRRFAFTGIAFIVYGAVAGIFTLIVNFFIDDIVGLYGYASDVMALPLQLSIYAGVLWGGVILAKQYLLSRSMVYVDLFITLVWALSFLTALVVLGVENVVTVLEVRLATIGLFLALCMSAWAWTGLKKDASQDAGAELM